MMGGQSTNIPLKVNTAGVIPVIFASSIMSFPSIIAQFAAKGMEQASEVRFSQVFPPITGVILNRSSIDGVSILYRTLRILFAYFYTSITFNPLEVADNIKKQGGFIPGIRPGKPTSDY